jgi:SAM-dependent methyltransferase
VSWDIITLPRAVEAPEGKPVRPEAADNQRLMAQIVDDPTSWTPELARFTTQVFDALADNWVDERGGYRAAPVVDALERGGPFGAGRCLEIGSGTGILTPYLEAIWADVVCVDLSAQMLAHHRIPRRIRADAGALPFPDRSFDVVVIGDGPLFADETVRVLSPTGTLIWSNALGEGAPYYVPTADLWDALARAAKAAAWSATESEALWGSWVVFRASEPDVR